MNEQILSWDYDRRFGLELELNAVDGRDFVLFPLSSGELPRGIDYIADLIKEITKKPVIVDKWHYTHNNDAWVLKPDRSCGIEICTPVSKGWYGLNKISEVIDGLRKDPLCIADNRCSVHVHVEVADCGNRDLASILAWWIKCEAVFLDSVPPPRKRSRFCQSLGTTDMFYSEDYIPQSLFSLLSTHKYFTANTYHMARHRRATIEFRIMGEEGCKSAYITRNWIRLLVHFVEMTKKRQCPRKYRPGNSMTGLCWLDLIDVMKILGFMGEYILSPGLQELRNWFLYRIQQNVDTDFQGMWSKEFRKNTRTQLAQILDKLQLDISPKPESMYNELYRI